jgi:enolase
MCLFSFICFQLVGREVLDSRANPTVECDVYGLVRGDERLLARAAAPSGASTGSNEAAELRDDDKTRYMGKGVIQAVSHVNQQLNAAVKGQDPRNLKALDDILCAADGTQLKKNLGGNAITAASFAIAEAGAQLSNKELFLHLAAFFNSTTTKFSLPRPMVNILNGGKHAGGDLKIQEFMIVPKRGNTFKENLRIITEVYHHLAKILVTKKGVRNK